MQQIARGPRHPAFVLFLLTALRTLQGALNAAAYGLSDSVRAAWRADPLVRRIIAACSAAAGVREAGGASSDDSRYEMMAAAAAAESDEEDAAYEDDTGV